MLDVFGLPETLNSNVTIFRTGGASGSGTFQTWTKPRNCSMVYILCIGGGGGGGAGFSAASGSARGGGAGGGSGGISTGFFLADQIPDTLFCAVGKGGDSTVAGAQSRVQAYGTANNTAITLLYANGGGAGSTGTGSGGGSAGSAGSIASAANCVWSSLGITRFQAGVAGIVGGAQTGVAGGNRSIVSAAICTGGAGGGGVGTGDVDTAGGTVNSAGAANLQQLDGGTAGGGAGNPGYDLINSRQFISSGGTGGGTNGASGTGGAGGVGGFGSGGGGGGAGVTGGAGGRGGDGLIMIVSW